MIADRLWQAFLAAGAFLIAGTSACLAQSQGLIGTRFEMIGTPVACVSSSTCTSILGVNNSGSVIAAERVNCLFTVFPGSVVPHAPVFGPANNGLFVKSIALPIGNAQNADPAAVAEYVVNEPVALFIGAGRQVAVTLSTFSSAQVLSVKCSMAGTKIP